MQLIGLSSLVFPCLGPGRSVRMKIVDASPKLSLIIRLWFLSLVTRSTAIAIAYLTHVTENSELSNHQPFLNKKKEKKLMPTSFTFARTMFHYPVQNSNETSKIFLGVETPLNFCVMLKLNLVIVALISSDEKKKDIQCDSLLNWKGAQKCIDQIDYQLSIRRLRQFYPNWQNLNIDSSMNCRYSDETKCVTLSFSSNGYPITDFNFTGQSIFYIHQRNNTSKIGFSIGNIKWPCEEFLENSEHLVGLHNNRKVHFVKLALNRITKTLKRKRKGRNKRRGSVHAKINYKFEAKVKHVIRQPNEYKVNIFYDDYERRSHVGYVSVTPSDESKKCFQLSLLRIKAWKLCYMVDLISILPFQA
ncbi:13351_t:CDS:2 [Acaulospora morrowiae]|uniref:13351_t:CDS:1 n=1 Tax=Acaulospora morrowiae TaxID=94023 RepID=A0A9N9F3N3_9GLOM|nr:13351_t:CDS:2 [Acaulospora morrowiae]